MMVPTAMKIGMTALMCSHYFDSNTSSIIMVHTMASNVLMTRYSNCIEYTEAEAEGRWQVAIGSQEGETLIANSGFHETGKILSNSIVWSNGAVWALSPRSEYFTYAYGLVRLKTASGKGSYEVVTEESTTLGRLTQTCNDVTFNSSRGVIDGNFVMWSDGDIWYPTFDETSSNATSPVKQIRPPPTVV